ncbi:37S ribosomal protein, mitochondrial [Ceratobasidium sp. 394]|nr:37S ribosomal protein, mitochondrial [Ceratobasidium sp. 394]KAG9097077.1 37S ribosomal protein, mitochondrial [Ceratobasidium sp. UAMH 11750]
MSYFKRAAALILSCKRASTSTNVCSYARGVKHARFVQTQETDSAVWTEMAKERARRKAVINYFSKLGSTQNRDNSFQPHHTLHKPAAPSELTMSALVAAGAHLGSSSTSTRPTFLPYAYGQRAGITIIDLDITLPLLRRASNVVREVAKNSGLILFVGTNESLAPCVRKAAQRLGSQGFHVGTTWKPGTLTNAWELFGSETMMKLNTVPDLVVFLNPLQNLHAIRECAISRVPTIGIIDSDVDPRVVMYPIPANDDSVRTAELIVGMLSMAGVEGIKQARDEKALAESQSRRARPSQPENGV